MGAHLSTWADDAVAEGGSMGVEPFLASPEGQALLLWSASGMLAKREEGLATPPTKAYVKELRAFVLAIKPVFEAKGKYIPCSAARCLKLHAQTRGPHRGYCDAACAAHGATEQADALHALTTGSTELVAPAALAPGAKPPRPSGKWRDLRLLRAEPGYGASRGFLVSANEMRKLWAEAAPAELVPQLEAELDEYADACGELWEGAEAYVSPSKARAAALAAAQVGSSSSGAMARLTGHKDASVRRTAPAPAKRAPRKKVARTLLVQYREVRDSLPRCASQRELARPLRQRDLRASQAAKLRRGAVAQEDPDAPALADGLADVYRAALSAVVLLFRAACELAKSSGGYGVSYELKPFARAWLGAHLAAAADGTVEGCAALPLGTLDASRLCDVARARVLFNDVGELAQAASLLATDAAFGVPLGLKLLRFEDALGEASAEGADGGGGRCLVARLEVGGHVCELQLMPRSLADAATRHGPFARRWIAARASVLERGYHGRLDGRGRRHGLGSCYYGDGSCYAGEWRAGKRHGLGVLTKPDGELREGGWRDDEEHGAMRWCRVPDGSVVHATWRGGRVHGWGRDAMWDGEVYEGPYEAGRRHGAGLRLVPVKAAGSGGGGGGGGGGSDDEEDDELELSLLSLDDSANEGEGGARRRPKPPEERDVQHADGALVKDEAAGKGKKAIDARSALRQRVAAHVEEAEAAAAGARRAAASAPSSMARTDFANAMPTATDALAKHGLMGGVRFMRARERTRQKYEEEQRQEQRRLRQAQQLAHQEAYAAYGGHQQQQQQQQQQQGYYGGGGGGAAAGGGGGEWSEHFDEASGYAYWVNDGTGESTYENPYGASAVSTVAAGDADQYQVPGWYGTT